jgi:hypothetical protein
MGQEIGKTLQKIAAKKNDEKTITHLFMPDPGDTLIYEDGLLLQPLSLIQTLCELQIRTDHASCSIGSDVFRNRCISLILVFLTNLRELSWSWF